MAVAVRLGVQLFAGVDAPGGAIGGGDGDALDLLQAAGDFGELFGLSGARGADLLGQFGDLLQVL